jgi:hypothetical protein
MWLKAIANTATAGLAMTTSEDARAQRDLPTAVPAATWLHCPY